MKIYHVKAFCNQDKGGNPAGVVLNADWITEQDMQNLAKVVNYSETAFVMTSEKADFRVRFFTPVSEVDLCGHATVAAFHVLFQEGFIQAGSYKQETLAGILGIEVSADGRIFLEQPLPTYYDILDSDLIAESLNISADQIVSPVQVVSTGFKDAIIQVKDNKVLQTMIPDQKKIKKLCQDHGFGGYHVFCQQVGDYKARCRNFAPLYDIPEEAATGTASGALTAYMTKYMKKDLADGPYLWIYEQGLEMNQHSKIQVLFEIEDKALSTLWVGGFGKTFPGKIED